MAIKWKNTEQTGGGRVRALAGFLAFFLGVSLVLNGLAGLWSGFSTRSGRQWARDAYQTHQTSYQDTTEFRNYMAGYLARFLSMAAGGPVSGHYSWRDDTLTYTYGSGYWYDDWDSYWDNYWNETAIIEAEAMTDAIMGSLPDLYGWDYETDWGAASGNSDSSAPRDYSREAEAAHRYFQEDKNVLYRISYDGELKYTNMEGDSGQYPEGYNFFLRFENGRVSITQNGRELDVYGDGYYTEDSDWYVPGYRNFTVDEQTAKATVVIAVAEKPALYIKGNYGSGGAEQQYNQLYWLARNLEQHWQNLLGQGIGLAAGLVLVLFYVLLRRSKARADRAIAGVTGRLWFEVKILLVLAAFFLAFPRNEYTFYLLEEISYAYGGYAVPLSEYSWVLRELLGEWLDRPLALFGLFWVCYLGINDLRYGSKPWRRGLFGLIRAKELKLPIQKRMSRRTGIALAAGTVLCLDLVYLLLVVWNNRWYCDVSASGFEFVSLVAVLAGGLALWALLGGRQRQLWNDIGALTGQIEAVRAGNLTDALPLPEDGDLRRAAEQLNGIQQGMAEALDQQTRSERMKVELIANVSHDLKTPLTSIISYGELLSQEEDLPDHVRDYVRILNEKALRLKTMVQDVFEVSKAHSGQLPVKLEALDLGKLLRQTMADMAEEIERAPVTLKPDVPEEPVPIVADGARLYRVFQNLIQNALKYSLEGSRVYLALETQDGKAIASVKNTSRNELPEGVDFTGRFVRGDESRTDGGSGLGLSIAETFTEACGGTLRVEPIADLFVAVVEFPLYREQ